MKRYLLSCVLALLLPLPAYAVDLDLRNADGTKTAQTDSGASGAGDVSLKTYIMCENAGYDQTNPTVAQSTSWCATRPQPFITYMASSTWTPPATPTDLSVITGSATKTVKVWSWRICTTNTAAGSQQFSLIKRSTADTTGTFVASTVVPLDSASAAATASIGHYTANPGALGTVVGTLNTVRIASPVLVPATFAGIVQDACYEMIPAMRNGIYVQPIVLRGIAEQLAINFGGAALVSGQIHAQTAVVSEEP